MNIVPMSSLHCTVNQTGKHHHRMRGAPKLLPLTEDLLAVDGSSGVDGESFVFGCIVTVKFLLLQRMALHSFLFSQQNLDLCVI